MTLAIPQPLMRKIRQHAEAHYPEEGVGLILGSIQDEVRVAAKIMPMRNVFAEESRRTRYSIDPLETLAAEDEADRLGLQIIGVFHSHPDHPPIASEFDRRMAVPWYSYLITSVSKGAAGESAAWRLDEDSEEMMHEQLQVYQAAAEEEET